MQGTAYETCQQDTDQEAATTVAVLCSFQRGTRAEQPDFGITDPTFQQMPVDTAEIQRQVALYEPRARLHIKVTDEDTHGGQQVTLAVHIATVGEEETT